MNSIALVFELLGEQPDSLIVLTCDSGSDKAFDLIGTPKAIKWLKELVVDLWNRIVFYREKVQDARISLVAKSLPVLEQIEALEQAGTLGRQRAEILKRSVVEAATGFVESGAITAEMESTSAFSPRQLLAPQRKLLAGPTTSSPEPSNATEQDGAHPEGGSEQKPEGNFGLSPEDIEAVKDFLKKKKESQPRRPKKRGNEP